VNTARKVARNTGILLLARAFSIGLGLVYVAVLARYIHADGMGKIATATTLCALLSQLALLGVSQVIIRDVAADKSRTPYYASNTLLMRSLLCLVFVIVTVVVAHFVGYPPDTTYIIYVYCFAYAFDALGDIARSIFSAHEDMQYQAGLQMIRDVINISLSLAAIWLGASLIIIVLISALADLVKLGLSLLILRLKYVRSWPGINLGLVQRLVVSALPFAAVSAVFLVDSQIDTLILSSHRSATEVGWFAAANSVITYLTMVPIVFMQAVFPVFSKYHVTSQEALREGYHWTFKYLMLLGFALCIGLIVTADTVIRILYGPGYENAAISLRILSLILFWLFGHANGNLLNATGGQKLLAKLAVAAVVINVFLALTLIPAIGYLGASIAAIAGGVVFSMPITIICHRRLGMPLPLGNVAWSLLAALLMGAAVAIAQRNAVHVAIAVCVIAPLTYGMALIAFHVLDRSDLMMFSQVLGRHTQLDVPVEVTRS
jgi:O-antigen/teichoic acid export membrane protein